jgi:hypothetical protein
MNKSHSVLPSLYYSSSELASRVRGLEVKLGNFGLTRLLKFPAILLRHGTLPLSDHPGEIPIYFRIHAYRELLVSQPKIE